MSISLKTHKMLWGRSGNMCAFPDCKKILVIDETFTDDSSVIGEEAHIVGQKENGPRGISDLTADQRDKYDNLILLCNSHHKEVDDQPIYFSIEKLKAFKATHEQWVKSNLVTDIKKLKDDELYANYIEKFVEFSSLDQWREWTSWALGAASVLPTKPFDLLNKLPDYIVSRVWPRRYPQLENALINFKNILNDLNKVYNKYPSDREDCYAVEKFYKRYQRENFYDSTDYDYVQENNALNKYKYHLALIQDLVLELTRAANYICDFVREFVFEGFRLEEGILLVTTGDFLGYKTYRVEYQGTERSELPYRGLRDFMSERDNRDLNFGEGIEEDYFAKMPWE